jgi:hypothetical protein
MGTPQCEVGTDERKMRIQFRKTAATLNVSALVLPMRLYLPCQSTHCLVSTACDCYSVVALPRFRVCSVSLYLHS